MKKREASSNTVLNLYLRAKRKEGFYCFYELKVARGETFNFSALEEGQKTGLPALERNGLVWKLSDMDIRLKPCDGFSIPPLPTYLVIKFGKTFYFVRYNKVQEAMAEGKKSFTHETVKTIAEQVFHTS